MRRNGIYQHYRFKNYFKRTTVCEILDAYMKWAIFLKNTNKLAQDKIGKIITYINRRLVIFLRNGNLKKITVKINLGPNYITDELYQTLEDLTPIPFRLFQK